MLRAASRDVARAERVNIMAFEGGAAPEGAALVLLRMYYIRE